MVIEDKGRKVNGDKMGIMKDRYLSEKKVVKKISKKREIEESGWLENIKRKRIGQKYVVVEMESEVENKVVGLEENGGFIIGEDVELKNGLLRRIKKRDEVLKEVDVIEKEKEKGMRLSEMVDKINYSLMKEDRVKEVKGEREDKFLKDIEK